MFEVSWFAFYLIIHLMISAFILPCLYFIGERLPQPQWLLRLWSFAAVIVFVLPILLLQPWALDRQVLPWFHGSIKYLSSTPQLSSIQLTSNQLSLNQFTEDEAESDVYVQANPAAKLNSAPSQFANPPSNDELLRVRQYSWPVISQVIYLFSPAMWLWLLLPLGTAWQLLRLLGSYLMSRRIYQQALPLAECATSSLMTTLTQVSSLAIKVHPNVPSAMLLGLRKPVIVLPQGYLSQCSASELMLIVKHEHVHYQNQDLYAFSLQQLVGCLCWWSPAWRVIDKQLERWRELRCDLQVSVSLAEPSRYAQTLLDCAKRMHLAKAPTASQLFVQRWLQPSMLALRIDAVLSGQPPQHPWRFRTLLLFMLGFCLGIGWLAQRWQLADLPAKHAQVRLSQLQPLASLLQAVAANDRAEVIRLLDQGAPLNLAMPGEGSALMVAVNHGLFEQVELLLARGADVEVSSRGDGNALIIAASRGDLVLAKRLLDAGANVNAAVLADETALINASYRNDFAMVQLLLNHGADINLQVETPISDGPEMRSPLSRARTSEMRQYLIAKGAR